MSSKWSEPRPAVNEKKKPITSSTHKRTTERKERSTTAHKRGAEVKVSTSSSKQVPGSEKINPGAAKRADQVAKPSNMLKESTVAKICTPLSSKQSIKTIPPSKSSMASLKTVKSALQPSTYQHRTNKTEMAVQLPPSKTTSTKPMTSSQKRCPSTVSPQDSISNVSTRKGSDMSTNATKYSRSTRSSAPVDSISLFTSSKRPDRAVVAHLPNMASSTPTGFVLKSAKATLTTGTYHKTNGDKITFQKESMQWNFDGK